MTVPDKYLAVLPAGIAPGLGATYFVPVTTAATALRSVGRIGRWGTPDVGSSADEVVLVTGAVGAVGTMVAQLALRDRARVLGLVLDQHQADLLPAGVEPLISSNPGGSEFLGKERPATLLVDTMGGRQLADRIGWVRPGGRAVSIGYVTGGEVTLNLPNWLLLDVPLLPVNMIRRSAEARGIAEDLAPLVASGDLVLEVEEFEFADAAHALKMLGIGRIRGRAVLVPTMHRST